ncbi:MAG: S41 family peptidase, partial [Patescibacteria group bacterium]
EISIVRDTITIPTVDSKMLEKKIAYIRISYFNEDTWTEFDKAVRNLLPQTPAGIILDMRSNPGGYLETAIDIASEWIPESPIMREESRGETGRDYAARGSHRLRQMPTVVLVDGGTASASEIVAGALQDYKRATLVGMKTFGKGSVQDFEVFPDGSALKLTIAKWLTPNRRHIDGVGIEPDIALQSMFATSTPQGPLQVPKDLGIEKAMEILLRN